MAVNDPFADLDEQPSADPFSDLDTPSQTTSKKLEQSSGLLRQTVADPALMLGTGVANVAKGALSLGALGADIASAPARMTIDAITGRESQSAPASALVAKGLEASGFNTLTDKVKDLYSPEAKAATAAAQARTRTVTEAAKARGVGAFGEIGANIKGAAQGIWETPRAAVPLVVENIPQLAGIALTSRALLAKTVSEVQKKIAAGTLTKKAGDEAIRKAAQKVSTGVEGGFVAGAVANEIAEQDPNADLLHRAAAIPAGIVSAGISRATGKLTGLDNIEGQLAAKGFTGPTSGKLVSAGKGAISEGVLQEPWQEGQEQIWTNLGTKSPWQEGVGEGMVYGAVAGGGMGAAGGAFTGGKPKVDPTKAVLDHIEKQKPSDMQLVILRNSPDQLEKVGLTPEHIDSLLAKRDSNSVEIARFQAAVDNAPNKTVRDGLLATAQGIEYTRRKEAEQAKKDQEILGSDLPYTEAVAKAQARREELDTKLDLTDEEAAEFGRLNKAGVDPQKLSKALGVSITEIPDELKKTPPKETLYSEAVEIAKARIEELRLKSFRTTSEKAEAQKLVKLFDKSFPPAELAKQLGIPIKMDPKKKAEEAPAVKAEEAPAVQAEEAPAVKAEEAPAVKAPAVKAEEAPAAQAEEAPAVKPELVEGQKAVDQVVPGSIYQGSSKAGDVTLHQFRTKDGKNWSTLSLEPDEVKTRHDKIQEGFKTEEAAPKAPVVKTEAPVVKTEVPAVKTQRINGLTDEETDTVRFVKRSGNLLPTNPNTLPIYESLLAKGALIKNANGSYKINTDFSLDTEETVAAKAKVEAEKKAKLVKSAKAKVAANKPKKPGRKFPVITDPAITREIDATVERQTKKNRNTKPAPFPQTSIQDVLNEAANEKKAVSEKKLKKDLDTAKKIIEDQRKAAEKSRTMSEKEALAQLTKLNAERDAKAAKTQADALAAKIIERKQKDAEKRAWVSTLPTDVRTEYESLVKDLAVVNKKVNARRNDPVEGPIHQKKKAEIQAKILAIKSVHSTDTKQKSDPSSIDQTSSEQSNVQIEKNKNIRTAIGDLLSMENPTTPAEESGLKESAGSRLNKLKSTKQLTPSMRTFIETASTLLDRIDNGEYDDVMLGDDTPLGLESVSDATLEDIQEIMLNAPALFAINLDASTLTEDARNAIAPMIADDYQIQDAFNKLRYDAIQKAADYLFSNLADTELDVFEGNGLYLQVEAATIVAELLKNNHVYKDGKVITEKITSSTIRPESMFSGAIAAATVQNLRNGMGAKAAYRDALKQVYGKKGAVYAQYGIKPDGWHKFEQGSDPAPLGAIAATSPGGWCTGYGAAPSHIQGGDFYIFSENGEAKIAIRMEGDEIAEASGSMEGQYMTPEEAQEAIRYAKENELEGELENGVISRIYQDQVNTQLIKKWITNDGKDPINFPVSIKIASYNREPRIFADRIYRRYGNNELLQKEADRKKFNELIRDKELVRTSKNSIHIGLSKINNLHLETTKDFVDLPNVTEISGDIYIHSVDGAASESRVRMPKLVTADKISISRYTAILPVLQNTKTIRLSDASIKAPKIKELVKFVIHNNNFSSAFEYDLPSLKTVDQLVTNGASTTLNIENIKVSASLIFSKLDFPNLNLSVDPNSDPDDRVFITVNGGIINLPKVTGLQMLDISNDATVNAPNTDYIGDLTIGGASVEKNNLIAPKIKELDRVNIASRTNFDITKLSRIQFLKISSAESIYTFSNTTRVDELLITTPNTDFESTHSYTLKGLESVGYIFIDRGIVYMPDLVTSRRIQVGEVRTVGTRPKPIIARIQAPKVESLSTLTIRNNSSAELPALKHLNTLNTIGHAVLDASKLKQVNTVNVERSLFNPDYVVKLNDIELIDRIDVKSNIEMLNLRTIRGTLTQNIRKISTTGTSSFTINMPALQERPRIIQADDDIRKASVGSGDSASTVADLESRLSKEHGKDWDKLKSSGQVVVVQTVQDALKVHGAKSTKSKNTQALYNPKTGISTIIADNTSVDDVLGILAHEVSVHGIADTNLDNQALELYNTHAKTKFMRAVKARLDDAGLLDENDVPTDNNEVRAYIVEEAINRSGHTELDSKFWQWARWNLPKGLVNWLQELATTIKSALINAGLMTDRDLTVVELVNLAKAGVSTAANRGAVPTTGQTIAEDSNGIPTKYGPRAEVTDIIPLTLYHGGPAGTTDFNTPLFTTIDKQGAQWFAEDRDGVVYELPAKFKKSEIWDLYESDKALVELAKSLDVEIDETDGFFNAPEVRDHSPYEGINVADLVYIPKVREAIQAKGYKAVRVSDTLTNDEIDTYIILDTSSLKASEKAKLSKEDATAAKVLKQIFEPGKRTMQETITDIIRDAEMAASNPTSRMFYRLTRRINAFSRDKNNQNSTFWDRYVSSPEFYFKKTNAGGAILQAAVDDASLKYTAQQRIVGDFLDLANKVLKKNKVAYKAANNYLVKSDQTGIGFKLREKDGKWEVRDRKEKVLLTSPDEKFAEQKMFEAEQAWLDTQLMHPDAKALILEARKLTSRAFDILIIDMRAQIKRAADNELDEPKAVFVDDEGKSNEVSLSELIAQMGDLRGTYFPRERVARKFHLYAEQDGKPNVMETFDWHLVEDESGDNYANMMKRTFNNAMPAGQRFNALLKEGYKYENIMIKPVQSPSELLFDLPGVLSSLDAIFSTATEKMNVDTLEEADRLWMGNVDKALALRVADIYKAKGNLSSRMSRAEKVWEGYETDMIRALTGYGTRVSTGVAKRVTARKMLEAITGRTESWKQYSAKHPDAKYTDYLDFVKGQRVSPTKQKEMYEDLRQYIKFFLSPDDTAARLIGYIKAAAVLKYLGFRVASAAINMTNLVMSVPATIAAHTGGSLGQVTSSIASATRALIAYKHNQLLNKGWKFLGRPMRLSEDDFKAIETIVENGWAEAQFNHDAAQAMTGMVGREMNSLMAWAMLMFGATEKANRAVTILAGVHQFSKHGLKLANGSIKQLTTGEKLSLAKHASDRAHGIYGKAAKPFLVQKHRFLDAPYTFQKFQHTYHLNMLELTGKYKRPSMSAFMMLSPQLFAGTSVAATIGFFIAGLAGMDDPEESYTSALATILGDSQIARDFSKFGVVGAAFGINLKGSLEAKSPFPSTLGELFGAPQSVFVDIKEGITAALDGQGKKAAEHLLPSAFGSWVKGRREITEGLTKKNYAPVFEGGERVMGTEADFVLRFMSFNPARISDIRNTAWKEDEVRRAYQNARTEISTKYNQLLVQGISGNSPEWAEFWKTVATYNDRASTAKPKYDIPLIGAKFLKQQEKRAFKPDKYGK